MSRKLIYLLLAVSLGVNAGVIAMTLIHRPAAPLEGPPPGPGGGGGRLQSPDRLVDQHVTSMTRHLGLDSRQQQAVRAVLERHAPLLIQSQQDVAEAARRLSEAFAAPEFDPEAFRRRVAETGAARARVDSLSAVMLVAEAAVLTPAQRVQFAEVAPMVHSGQQGGPQNRPQGNRPPPPGDRPPPRQR